MSKANPMERPTPLSSTTTRSRRSNLNLANLRLSPLSPKFTGENNTTSTDALASDEAIAAQAHHGSAVPAFRRSHSSYIQGQSAPTTPGILSRSSSRRRLGGGLSRRGSVGEREGGEEGGYEYAGLVVTGDSGSARVPVGSGLIPKAKSEAALVVERSHQLGSTKGAKKRGTPVALRGSRTGGTNTPRFLTVRSAGQDDWLTRTGAAASAMRQESKGQSWMASRASSTSLVGQGQDTTDEEEEDEDEGYEELAAQSAGKGEGEWSARANRWGSRYGSRTGSRRTSRRGSVTLTTGSRTPLASAQLQMGEYFDLPGGSSSLNMSPDFVDGDEEDEDGEGDGESEATLNRLAQTRSFGMGGILDRIMNFSLFDVEEGWEGEESGRGAGDGETEAQAQAMERREAERKRRREEKEKLISRSGGGDGQDGEGGEGNGGGAAAGGAWADAAWLLSVASKAMF